MNQTTAPMTEPQVKYITKLARKQMSRIGFVYFAGTILLVALELSLSMLFLFGNPDGDYDSSILIFFNLIFKVYIGLSADAVPDSFSEKGKAHSAEK